MPRSLPRHPRPAFPLLASTMLVGAAGLLGACDIPETGANGVVQFVPEECNLAICAFSDRLAVGGEIDLALDGVDGAFVDDLRLESQTPWVADVVAELGGPRPRFRVVGNEPGQATLAAVDRRGEIVDYVTLEVAPIDEVILDVAGATVIGPLTTDDGALGRYLVAPGDTVTLDATALATRREIMGHYPWAMAIEGTQPVDMVTDAAEGHLELRAPEGEYAVTFTAPAGMSETVFLSVH